MDHWVADDEVCTVRAQAILSYEAHSVGHTRYAAKVVYRSRVQRSRMSVRVEVVCIRGVAELQTFGAVVVLPTGEAGGFRNDVASRSSDCLVRDGEASDVHRMYESMLGYRPSGSSG